MSRAAVIVALALVLTACGGTTQPVASASPASEAQTAARWQPRPGVSWQIQLQGTIRTSIPARVYEIDGLDNSAALVRRLQAKGRKVICYFSAGTYESFRADRDRIPPETRGKPLDDFPDEQWLDIRALDKLRPVIESRLETCRRKGFDAVDFDNVDGYSNDSGFPLTAADQLRFNRFLAERAHAAGLAAGLKNDLEQIPQLVGDFDFAVNEQCFEYDECNRLLPFLRRKKAVFHIEYRRKPSQYCRRAKQLKLSSVYKKLDLKSFRIAC